MHSLDMQHMQPMENKDCFRMGLHILTAFKKITRMKQIRIILQPGWQHLDLKQGGRKKKKQATAYSSDYITATVICTRDPKALMPKIIYCLKS